MNGLPIPVEMAIVIVFVANAVIGAIVLGMADPYGPWHRWPASLGEFLSQWLVLEFWPVVLVILLVRMAAESSDDDARPR